METYKRKKFPTLTMNSIHTNEMTDEEKLFEDFKVYIFLKNNSFHIEVSEGIIKESNFDEEEKEKLFVLRRSVITRVKNEKKENCAVFVRLGSKSTQKDFELAKKFVKEEMQILGNSFVLVFTESGKETEDFNDIRVQRDFKIAKISDLKSFELKESNLNEISNKNDEILVNNGDLITFYNDFEVIFVSSFQNKQIDHSLLIDKWIQRSNGEKIPKNFSFCTDQTFLYRLYEYLSEKKKLPPTSPTKNLNTSNNQNSSPKKNSQNKNRTSSPSKNPESPQKSEVSSPSGNSPSIDNQSDDLSVELNNLKLIWQQEIEKNDSYDNKLAELIKRCQANEKTLQKHSISLNNLCKDKDLSTKIENSIKDYQFFLSNQDKQKYESHNSKFLNLLIQQNTDLNDRLKILDQNLEEKTLFLKNFDLVKQEIDHERKQISFLKNYFFYPLLLLFLFTVLKYVGYVLFKN